MFAIILEMVVDTFAHPIQDETEAVTLAIVDAKGIHMFGELK